MSTIILDGKAPNKTGGKYEIIQDVENPYAPYSYVIKASNGQVMFTSEGYKIKPRAKQIEILKKVINLGHFIVKSDKTGTYQFKLYDEDGRLFGVGVSYKTKLQAQKSFESVKNIVAVANVMEDTTEPAEEKKETKK